MKLPYFFAIWAILIGGLIELVSRNLFHVSSWSLWEWWLKESDKRLLIILLVGFFGMLFLIFISARTSQTFLVMFGKVTTYVFTGDRLREGFYGYQEGRVKLQEEFIATNLDASVYPATSFQSLFYRKVVYKSPTGETVNADFLHLGNLIVWSIITVFLFVLLVAGLLLLFKEYANAHQIELTGNGIADIAGWVRYHLDPTLLYASISIGLVPFLFIVVIKINTRHVTDQRPAAVLPNQVKEGSILIGRVIASEKYNAEPGSKRSIYDARFNRRFTIQFDERSGFEIPVYVNWDARDITEGNLENKSKGLVSELKIKKQYYDSAFLLLEKAQNDREDVQFLVIQDMCIIPYLEKHKTQIPELLNF